MWIVRLPSIDCSCIRKLRNGKHACWLGWKDQNRLCLQLSLWRRFNSALGTGGKYGVVEITKLTDEERKYRSVAKDAQLEVLSPAYELRLLLKGFF